MRHWKSIWIVIAAAACSAASDDVGMLRVAPASPAHRIRLERFIVPVNQVAGVLVQARINGAPPLRLLLDSGAQYVVLGRGVAQRCGLTSHAGAGADLDLVGAGARDASVVKEAAADNLEVGDLTLHDVPVLISDRPMPDGIQGVLPLPVFAGFIVRLNLPARELDLFAYPAGSPDRTGALPVRVSHELLFIQGTLNDASGGYFLVDTGSAYSAVSRNLARQLHQSELMASRVSLQGGIADMDAPLLSGPFRLQSGTQIVSTHQVVAVDLSTASRYHNFEISGLIGYSALCGSVLTVNYRDGILRIDPK